MALGQLREIEEIRKSSKYIGLKKHEIAFLGWRAGYAICIDEGV